MAKRITGRQLDIYTEQLSEIYEHLEQEVFMEISRLLKAPKDLDRDRALQWQVEKLRQLGALDQFALKELSRIADIVPNELARMLNEIAEDTIFTVDKQVTALGVNIVNAPTELGSLLEVFLNNALNDLDSFTNVRLLNNAYGEGLIVKMAKDIIDKTTSSVIAGNLTVNQAVAKTVIEYRDKGLPTAFVDKGGRTWNLQNYADLVVRTNANNVFNQVTENRMADYGIDLVLVDTYPSARPTCTRIQGKVCSLKNPSSNPKYPSIYEFKYKQPDGIRGIHCRHSLYPWVEGASTNNQPKISVAESTKVYKQMQHQRSLERKIRRAKQDLQLAEAIGDETQINRAKGLIRKRQELIRYYLEETGLPRRYDKERVI